MTDFFLLSKIEKYISRRVSLPPYFQKSAGAYGVFTPYMTFDDYTTAEFVSNPDKSTDVFVKFSMLCEKIGGADTVRDIRGMFVRFYSEENYDLICQNFPVFYINKLEKLQMLLEALDEREDTNVKDERKFWEFVVNNPEALNLAIGIYSDKGTIKSYTKQSYYSFFSTKWVNKYEKCFYVKYKWFPLAGEETITKSESEFLAGYNKDCCTLDLYEKIDEKVYPEFELQVQIISAESICNDAIWDKTKEWNERVIPYIPVGKLKLTDRPKNLKKEANKIAFTPYNLTPGIKLAEDQLSEGIAFLFSSCGRLKGGGIDE